MHNPRSHQLRATQTHVEKFAIAAFRNVFDLVIERWSDRSAPQPASSSADSGYASTERDASTSSFPQLTRFGQLVPTTSSEDESEPVVLMSADFGNGLSMDTDFAENFSMNSVISDLFDKLPEDASGFDFFTELER